MSTADYSYSAHANHPPTVMQPINTIGNKKPCQIQAGLTATSRAAATWPFPQQPIAPVSRDAHDDFVNTHRSLPDA